MEEKTNYENLIKEIKNKFPLLRNRKIRVKILNKFFSVLMPFSARADWDFGLFLVVRINPKYNIYDNFELKGLLAHELSHLEDWVSGGKFYKWFKCLKCGFSKRFNEKIEKETDKTAIRKGFKKELYAQRLKRESIKDKNYKKFKNIYLSSDEIKNFVI